MKGGGETQAMGIKGKQGEEVRKIGRSIQSKKKWEESEKKAKQRI